MNREQIIAARDLEEAVEADLQFHTAVIVASHNPLFRQLNTTIRNPFRIALSYTLLIPASVALELEEYRKLTEAIEARSPLEAKRSAEELVGVAMLAVEAVIRDRHRRAGDRPGTKVQRQEDARLRIARSRPEP